jgi:probable HAF family extracellular repeat protein
VNGDSWLAGNLTEHAVLWRPNAMGQLVITDLGTLGGNNSASAWPSSSKNNRGLVVGQAQSNETDPLGEYWGVDIGCGSASGHCTGWQNLQLGFVWQNGVMTALPTLGGNNGEATGVNNLGQVVGFAETATQDPNCVPPQVLDINAAVWGPKKGEVHALPPFTGDVLSAAAGINDNGDVVGGSGTCGIIESGALSVHAVVWRNGLVFNLPGLGGVMNNVALAINNAGQIAGISDPPGDATTYAGLWQNGAMTTLGPLPGDVMSTAYDINAQGQVVGDSCDANFNCRAFLWDKGVMMDLNSLIPSLGRTVGRNFLPRRHCRPSPWQLPPRRRQRLPSAEPAATATRIRRDTTPCSTGRCLESDGQRRRWQAARYRPEFRRSRPSP